ncbi:uncharacterized protein LOC116345714 [Contarinia nasturtii]|uniref:uncharacterized protein LOC116345714 n=1 Tax=Contarinia nasturtii TaxID=265458 RepID=UPI0012D3E82B|nr:uncharacterized protein LOC116345714 [Contarinia nasturtii]
MAKLSYVLFVTMLCGFSVNAGIPGGPRPITDEIELAKLTDNITTHLDRFGVQGTNFELVKLHSATVQVVAGVLYETLIEVMEKQNRVNCTMTMWEKAWENVIKVNVECGDEKRKYEWSTDVQPIQPIAFGGFTKLTENGIKYVEKQLTHSFGEMAKIHSKFIYNLKSVVSGSQQPVAGTHYMVTIEVGYGDNETKTCQADMIETLAKILRVKIECGEEIYEIETPSPQ